MCRVTRENFSKLIDLLKHHSAFKVYNKNKILNEDKIKKSRNTQCIFFILLKLLAGEEIMQIVEIDVNKVIVCLKIISPIASK